MHLRSITLRGFKSFADRTVLELEPGLVGIVGPNGAGKSNLIDALMWSLGTLSARTLRAEKMEDVIFTGTEGRKQLGMANVTLAFDNQDGTFPLSFSEVQVGRTLFRDGASDYSINGTSCRLLDVAELLAEAGLGRELHAVVAQGQVDDIVQSRPEELRAYIEEAAGIAKHRRRKERALRKIEQVSTDIDRLADLAGELRRQLRPLRAQAEQAKRHTEITDRLTEIRIRRAVAELEALDAERKRAMSNRSGASEALGDLRSNLDTQRNERLDAERRLDNSRRASSGMRKALEHLRSAQASTLRGVIVLRDRAHATPDLRRRDAIVSKLADLDLEETDVRETLAGLGRDLTEKDEALAGARKRGEELRAQIATELETLSHAREELGAVDAEARGAEHTEIAARAEAKASSERAERAGSEMSRLSDQADAVRREIEELDSGEGRASMTVDRLSAERRDTIASVEDSDKRLRQLESERAVLQGRAESLRVAQDLAAQRRKGAESMRDAHSNRVDARGLLGDLIRVPSGMERAVESILGPLLDALVVSGAKVGETVQLAEDAGTDVLVLPTLPSDQSAVVLIGDARPLSELVDGPSWLRGTIEAICADVYVVADGRRAEDLSTRYPDKTFVSSNGRIIRARGASKPASKGEHPLLALNSALERTETSLQRVESERAQWTATLDRFKKALERVEGELDEARSELSEIEGRIAAAADRLREIEAAERATSLERDLAVRDRDERLRRAETAAAERAQLAERRNELHAAEEGASQRHATAQEASTTAEAEISTLDEARTEMLTHRASLEERLRGFTKTREELNNERVDVEQGPTDPEDLQRAESTLQALDAFVVTAEAKVRELMDAEDKVEAELRTHSEETSKLEVQIASLEPRALHSSEEIARLDVRIEEIGSRLAHDFDIAPARAREEFPPSGDEGMLAEEERRLDRELRRMGPVNPLAAREIVELDKRREFLEGQLEDLRSSRRDLMKVVRLADTEMRELLVKAAEDANEAFQDIVGLLFPEGGGRIRLTGAEDPLEAGVEIEVRLGKKGHRKLSFLSGGEKALAGLGFLFSLHLARPTPFMVLDEVDAPLDDANLGRFLRLLDALRTKTQVIVITHQKRTMERSDTLIGVTLNPDGTSRVVTQRLREHAEHATQRVLDEIELSTPS